MPGLLEPRSMAKIGDLAKMEEDTAAIGAERLHECLNDGSGCLNRRAGR